MRIRKIIALVSCLACARGDLRAPADRDRGDSPAVLPTDPGSLAAVLGVPPGALAAAGEERYAAQSYDSALRIFAVEAARAREQHDGRAEARARMWLGLAAWRLGDYRVARREGEAALRLKRELHLDTELSRSFNALGLLAWNEGRYEDAFANFDSAIAAARRHDDSAGVARAASNVPLIKVELGDFEGARDGFETAYRLGRALDDERMQGNALSNLAMVEIRLGRGRTAIPLLRTAINLYSAASYTTGEANALGQLASAWAQVGDLQRALAAADSALLIARAHGMEQEIASELEVIADLHLQSGDAALALHRLQEADSLDAALGLRSERGANLRRVSTILLATGDTSGAITRASEAVALHAGVHAAADVVYDRLQLARALSAKRPAEARTQLHAARLEAAHLESPAVAREVATASARLALDAGRPVEALHHLGKVRTSTLPEDWTLVDMRTEALLATGQLAEAQRSGELAVRLLERERASLGVGLLRERYLASRLTPFTRLIAIHLARHDTLAAFRVASSLPGRAIVERLGMLAEAGPEIATATEAERMLLRIAALEQELTGVVEGAQGREQRRLLQHALDAARTGYEEFLARHGRQATGLDVGSLQVDASAIQARLGRDEAVVCFVAGPEHVDLFVVRPRELLYRSLPVGERELAARVRVVRGLLGSNRSPRALSALASLHETLLRSAIDAGAFTGVKRLIVVPQGTLSTIPFAALRDQRSSRFLIEDMTVRVMPSVALVRSVPRGAERPARLIGFAPLVDSLPGTGRELRAIARLMRDAQMRIGRASNEPEVRAALGSTAIVHIASHGLSNARNPMFSRIIVGRAARGPADDGAIAVHELLGMRIRSPLVFLSGCETALAAGDGTFGHGTEEESLAAAFLMAGTRSVVATLWRVNDAEAARIATLFYRALNQGLSPEDALAQAQRDEIRSGSTLTWASYTLSTATGANAAATSVKQEASHRMDKSNRATGIYSGALQ
jgi:CHAT domain-containing protein